MMGLSCCKKISVESRIDNVEQGNIKIQFDEQFEVPMASIKIDGFLTVYCRLCFDVMLIYCKKKKT